VTDFAEAVRRGIAAYNDAKRVRAEVGDVLAELSSEVHKASDGAIVVSVRNKSVNLNESTIEAARPDALEAGTYFLLVAYASHNFDVYEIIANISIDEKGSPVSFTYASETVMCFDREETVKTLNGLLSHPVTGCFFSRVCRGGKQ
jgi:hypothetical protein